MEHLYLNAITVIKLAPHSLERDQFYLYWRENLTICTT